MGKNNITIQDHNPKMTNLPLWAASGGRENIFCACVPNSASTLRTHKSSLCPGPAQALSLIDYISLKKIGEEELEIFYIE